MLFLTVWYGLAVVEEGLQSTELEFRVFPVVFEGVNRISFLFVPVFILVQELILFS